MISQLALYHLALSCNTRATALAAQMGYPSSDVQSDHRVLHVTNARCPVQAIQFRVLKPDGRQHGDRCYTCFVDLAVYSRRASRCADMQPPAMLPGSLPCKAQRRTSARLGSWYLHDLVIASWRNLDHRPLCVRWIE